MSKSEAFQRGYEAAQALWTSAALSNQPFDPPNPFPVGTDEENGFEAAVYDLTHQPPVAHS